MITDLPKRFEGCSLEPYLDPVGIPTIGWGFTHYEDGTRVTINDPPITQARADALLEFELLRLNIRIRARLRRPLTAGQRDALVDFAYNLGPWALFGSTLWRKFTRGDIEGAANEFHRWVYAHHRKLKGLVRRRAAERKRYWEEV